MQQYMNVCVSTLTEAKWLRGCRDFQHQAGIEPMPPHLLPLDYWAMTSYQSLIKQVHVYSRLATMNKFFRVQVCWLLKVNIKASLARHEIPELLTVNLLSIYVIALDIDWSWNFFTRHNFCSLLIKQLIDPRKVRTENLNLGQIFKIKLWMVDQSEDDCLHRQIAQKILKSKSKLILSTLVTTWISNLNSISFATNLAANFDCN